MDPVRLDSGAKAPMAPTFVVMIEAVTQLTRHPEKL